jgi:2-polyprenyl-3-methyl-5-hydroxy-6-metoxy-1,4-benzoquinol methylase
VSTSGTGPEVVSGYHDDVRDDVASYIPRTRGTLLDVGGGTGATAAYLKRRGIASRVGVIDQVASSRAAAGLDFHRSGDLEDSEFLTSVLAEEGPFEVILCLDILEHLVDPWSTVAALHRALAPGGHIVASIPNVRHWRVSAGLFLGNRWRLTDAGILDRTHLRFFVKDTAIELMTHTGLVLELVATPPRMRHPRVARLLHVVGRGRLDSLVAVDYVVRVRRDD